MEKVKLTKIYINDKDKEGKELITKTGKKFRKMTIQCDKYGNEYLSSLIFDDNDIKLNWKEGDEVLILVEVNGNFKNFKAPSRLDILEERVKKLEIGGNTPKSEIDDLI